MKKAWHQHIKRSPKELRTSRDGILFDSKGEMQHYEKLKLWQLAGEVRNLRRQVRFPLIRGEIEVKTDKGQIAHYTADFVYERKVSGGWEIVVADFKGFEGRLEMFRIKVFEALYDQKVTIIK